MRKYVYSMYFGEQSAMLPFEWVGLSHLSESISANLMSPLKSTKVEFYKKLILQKLNFTNTELCKSWNLQNFYSAGIRT